MFARLLCEDDEEAQAFAVGWLKRAASLEVVQETLLAPAARRLGDWWVEDLACFASVTLGMSALQRIMWALGRAVPAPAPGPGQSRLLLAGVPGEQHSFGLNLLAEQLRQRGGRPTLLPCPTRMELEAAVRFGGFEAVGLSVGSEASLDGLGPLVRVLRAAAPAPFHLMAGGALAAELAGRPDRGGVDEVVVDSPLTRMCQILFGDARRAGKSGAAAA